MKLNPMPVGSAVTIRKTSRFYGISNANPADMLGVVRRNEAAGYLKYLVLWENGELNSYRREDLKYWRGAGAVRPVPIPAVAPVAEPKRKLTLDELKGKAEKDCVAEGLGATARFAFISEDAGTYWVNTNTACHSQVINRTWNEVVLKGKPTHITTHLHRNTLSRHNVTTQERTTYFQWLFNDSPWSIAFLEKNAVECVERGFVLLTAKVAGPVLQGALVATRMPYEDSGRVKDFCKWADEGLSGNLSYLLASTVSLQGTEVVLSLHSGGHYAIRPYDMGKGCISRFLSNQLINLPPTTYYDGGTGSGVHKLFGEEERGRDFIQKVLKASQVGEAKTANTNPFAKALDREVNTFKTDLFVAHLKKKGLSV